MGFCNTFCHIVCTHKLPGEIATASENTDETTLMAESEEELRSLLMRVKEENEKAGLKLSINKAKIMASSWCHHLMAKRREKMEAENKMSLLGL